LTTFSKDLIEASQNSFCPICSHAANLWCEAQDHHYGNSGRWQVYRCSQCNHLFQYPLPKENELMRFYSKSYYAHQSPETDFVPRGFQHRGIWLKLHYLKNHRGYHHLTVSGNPMLGWLGLLLNYRPLCFDAPVFHPGGTLLDFGSGSGQAVAFARHLGWEAEGIEINAKAVEAGRAAGVKVDHGSIDALENRTCRYEYIMSSHCVEHVPEVHRLFRAFFHALKPGGILAIDVPNGNSAAAKRFQQFSYYLGMPVHVHLFSPTSIRLLSKSTGFVNIALATYSRWYTQAESAILLRASRRDLLPRQFHSHGLWEGLLGRLKSIPTYVLSRFRSRGDCLVMTCMKPIVSDRVIPESPKR
jgi:SAM-dependent methyltransferase